MKRHITFEVIAFAHNYECWQQSMYKTVNELRWGASLFPFSTLLFLCSALSLQSYRRVNSTTITAHGRRHSQETQKVRDSEETGKCNVVYSRKLNDLVRGECIKWRRLGFVHTVFVLPYDVSIHGEPSWARSAHFSNSGNCLCVLDNKLIN